MEALMNMFKGHALSIVVTIIGIVVAKYASKFFKLIEEKFMIDIDDKLESKLLRIIKKSVRIIYQTFVRAEKKAGSWNKQSKKEALGKAYDLIQIEASRTGLSSFVLGKDMFSEIESEIVEEKNNGRGTVISPKKKEK